MKTIHGLALSTALLVIQSGCSNEVRSLDRASQTEALKEMSVKPLYENAANWNDFVRSGDLSLCVGTETDCVHGGEKRKVDLMGIATSCDGISMTDRLGAFDWKCEILNGAPRIVGSLAANKSLADLIDSSATPPSFLKNSVKLFQSGRNLGQNSESAWWLNRIIGKIPSQGSVDNLDSEGALYVITESGVSDGFHIGANHISLIFPKGIKVTGTAFTNFNGSTMAIAGANQSAVIAVDSRVFTSIEGSSDWNYGEISTTDYAIDADNQALYAIAAFNSSYLRLKNLNLTNSKYHLFTSNYGIGASMDRINAGNAHYFGMRSTNGSQQRYSHMNFHHSTSTAFASIGTTGANYRDLYFEACPYGFAAGSVTNAVFENISAKNISAYGFYVLNATNSHFSEIHATRSGYGIVLSGNMTGNQFSNLNASENLYTGIISDGNMSGNTFDGIIALSNGQLGGKDGDGFAEENSSSAGNIYRQITASLNHGHGLKVASLNSVISGVTTSGNGGDGIQIAGAVKTLSLVTSGKNGGNGIHQTAIDSGTLYHQILSTENNGDGMHFDGESKGATLSQFVAGHNSGYGIFLADSASASSLKVVGNLVTTQNASGECRIPAQGALGITSAQCDLSPPSTGQVSHPSLPSAELVLRNRSGNAQDENGPFRPNDVCPRELAGDRNATSLTDAQPFLLNAVEDLKSVAGNHDGLCNEGESCLYTPNFGADQHLGESAACTYQSFGGLASVKVQRL